MTDPEQSLLSVRSLVKTFGGLRAIDSASFDIERNSITALIGPNGAGKTTLFNIMTGFMRPDAGQVLLNGINITGLPAYQLFRRGLIRTFQIPAAFERMTVLDNLMVVPPDQTGENVFLALTKLSRVIREERVIKQRADEVLDFLEITHVKDEYAGNLSGGQKKLLELGRTMMAEPNIILLDEPGAGVNPTLMVKLAGHIRRLNLEKQYSFCIIEHDMDLIASLCDPVIVMAEGRVLAQGDMSSIRANESVRDAYFGGVVSAEGASSQ